MYAYMVHVCKCVYMQVCVCVALTYINICICMIRSVCVLALGNIKS